MRRNAELYIYAVYVSCMSIQDLQLMNVNRQPEYSKHDDDQHQSTTRLTLFINSSVLSASLYFSKRGAY